MITTRLNTWAENRFAKCAQKKKKNKNKKQFARTKIWNMNLKLVKVHLSVFSNIKSHN